MYHIQIIFYTNMFRYSLISFFWCQYIEIYVGIKILHSSHPVMHWVMLIDSVWCWFMPQSDSKLLEHPFLNLYQMQYLSFCYTCAADCQRTRPLSIWPITEPPSKATSDHFSSAHCDTHPLHVPCLNKRSGNYMLRILPSSPSGSLVVNLAFVGS